MKLDLRRDGARARLEVRDRGIGIADEDRERVFERFVRLDGTHVPPTSGIGLGLYIGRRAARRYGGELALAGSEPGQGSTFALTLPLADQAPAAGQGSAGQAVAPAEPV